MDWGLITYCVTMRKLFNFSGPQSAIHLQSLLKNENTVFFVQKLFII